MNLKMVDQSYRLAVRLQDHVSRLSFDRTLTDVQYYRVVKIEQRAISRHTRRRKMFDSSRGY